MLGNAPGAFWKPAREGGGDAGIWCSTQPGAPGGAAAPRKADQTPGETDPGRLRAPLLWGSELGDGAFTREVPVLTNGHVFLRVGGAPLRSWLFLVRNKTSQFRSPIEC